MNITTLLKVFKKSYLVTDRGELKISRVFLTYKAAKKAQYRYYRVYNGIVIYQKRTRTGPQKYAVIGEEPTS